MGNVTAALLLFVVVGQFTFTIGLISVSPLLLIVGRLLLGVGGEFINITSATFCFKWFKGQEFSLASAVFISFMRIVSIANAISTPLIAHVSLAS